MFGRCSWNNFYHLCLLLGTGRLTIRYLICKQSLASRTCCFIKDGARCRRGYHLKATIYKEREEVKRGEVRSNRRMEGEPTKVGPALTQISENTTLPFQQDYIRLQIYQVLQEMRQPQNMIWAEKVKQVPLISQPITPIQEMRSLPTKDTRPSEIGENTPLSDIIPTMTVGELLKLMKQ